MKTTLSFVDYQKKLKNVRTPEEAEALARELMAPALEKIASNKQTQNNLESVPVEMPQGYHTVSTTVSKIIPKMSPWYDVIESEEEAIVVSLFAKGMSTRDIASFMKNEHKVDVDVSAITEKVLPLVKEWETRPLSPVYPVVYLDGMRFKVRDDGKILSKVANIVLGINQYGLKEVLGIWISDTEGAKFWLQVLNEIKNRGVEDIFFACVDGLKGFPEAIKAVYPDTEVQQCIVHQIRHTMKFVLHKDRDQFCADLREVYTAPTDVAGLHQLKAVQEKWPDYLIYLQKWESSWPELAPFFKYSLPVRKLIYTTNMIESLNSQFRKVTRATTLFPHDEALLKLLWLAQTDISSKWTLPINDWRSIMAQLTIMFPERVQF